ncbi:MAG: hypothetical protein ABIW46_02445 [Acidimicrobiales bacterium]
MGSDELQVEVRPFGPSPDTVGRLAARLTDHPLVRETLGRARHRVLGWELVEAEAKTARARTPTRWRATIYDYTNQRTLFAEDSLGDEDAMTVQESGNHPVPSPDEFAAAVQVLAGTDQFGPALRDGTMVAYPAMPPLVSTEDDPGGGLERTLAVGLLPTEGQRGHEIVGVNMARRRVVRAEGGSPFQSAAHNPICGLPYSSQPSAAKGTPGQAWVTVSQGGTVLWRFLVVRPAASSGTNGSGIELRYVDYKGKRLLYRAHVPILNVRYNGHACGPYLDWQYEEGMIQATGADVAPGFRLCPSPAKTILDTGSDIGNFLGVGIYVQGLEVVLVSELQAGWYRYVSEWRLHADGTVRPRFGFGATQNSCVCTVHHHHAYWRLDFDLRTPGHNRVREFNDPPLSGSSKWHTKRFETQRPRNPARQRRWRVENTVTGEAYDIVPGHDDGVATAAPDWPFPQGDVWLTRYRASELDNGVVATGPPYEANISNFVNGESIEDSDVVVWYGAHSTHDLATEPPGSFGHIVGPELRRVKW